MLVDLEGKSGIEGVTEQKGGYHEGAEVVTSSWAAEQVAFGQGLFSPLITIRL